MLPRNRGFSLLELLIVMALAACGYAMMFGPHTAWSQERAKARCGQQLQQMHVALGLYAAEHEGAFPAPADAVTSEPALSELVPLYTTDTSIFICPGSGLAALPGAEPFASRRCSYSYVAGLKGDASGSQPIVSDAHARGGAKIAGGVLFSTSGQAPGNNHRAFGGNILFVDGHVEQQGAVMALHDFALPPGTRLLNPRP